MFNNTTPHPTAAFHSFPPSEGNGRYNTTKNGAAALAAEFEGNDSVSFTEISQEDFGLDDLSLDASKVQQEPEAATYSARTPVRVSIVLEEPSTLEAGFSTMGIAENASAMAYRGELEREQVSLAQSISRQALNGQSLDVVWSLTLAANVISANVPYGRIDAIKAVPGVKDVVMETVYYPCVASVGGSEPNIAAANRYTETSEGSFENAADTVHMVGAAPDAQLMIMKVFGKNGGAYDSDYMAAIEDAIILGADVINLSLGSANPGFTTSEYYQNKMDALTASDTVVSISAGNNGAWAEYSANGYLYAEDVNYHTGGAPGAYANAFTVAAVDNCGSTGLSFRAADRDVVYTENLAPYNDYLTSMDTSEDGNGTEYPYVFLDKLGDSADYADIDVNGKVVFVSRGTTSFSQKLTNAAYAGAAACVIYNNVAGAAINMNLSDSYVWIPCVGITKSDADAIRAASTPVTDDAGNVLYYTGTMTIGSKIATSISDEPFYTMSDFSSWGVPSDLSLKPEITAPGGNIYSIDGATSKTDQYIIMGGTSMAAPHIAGLSALMAQYIRENSLDKALNISPRTLIQSLLMSTATPIVDGNSGLPYPVIQQGAGLANVQDAMNASSYILVDGQRDGKVKAELGDDPYRTGVYSFDYTLYNMTDKAQSYTLDGQVYTQDAFSYGGVDYADYTLRTLDAVVYFAADGNTLQSSTDALEGYDFNGGGQVSRADGQALVDYAVGNREALNDLENADLSGDGKVTAYDAQLFLDLLGKSSVLLPANDSVTVTVTIALTEAQKAELDEVYPNGAYIEAYITATPEADNEGVLASGHSIPMLAFYGGWDEASMFDRTTHTALVAGVNERESYIPGGIFGASDFNYVVMTDGDDGMQYYLGGNRFAEDDAYLPARNAIRSDAGDSIDQLHFALIRAAGAMRATITNADTGTVYGLEEENYIMPAFYFPNYGSWQAYDQWFTPGATDDSDGWMITDENGNTLPEGTRLELTLRAAAEMYLDADGNVDWDSLDADATTLSMPVTIDNTAPVLQSVSVGTETNPATGESYDYVEAVAQDNEYIAAVILLTPGETKVVGRQSANQTVRGAVSRVRLDITGVFGSTFKLAVVDYAGNAAYYNVKVSEPFAGPTNTLLGATMAHNGAEWHEFASDANYDYEALQATIVSMGGAAYGDGYLFYCSTAPGAYSSQYYLYVVDYPSFENPIQIGKVSGMPWGGAINYMTYNTQDGYLYFVKSGSLCKLDVATAEETWVASLDIDDYDLSGLAYSQKEDCFYAVGTIYGYDYETGTMQCPAALLRFELPENDESDESIVPEKVADFGVWNTYAASLVLDENQDAVYLVRQGNLYSDLLTYEFNTGTLTLTGQLDNHCAVVLKPNGEDENTISRTQPTGLILSAETLDVFISGSKVLTASVQPWCLANKKVIWTSSDPDVATVTDGIITGVAEGEAVITAASVLDENVTASCAVRVIGSNFTVQGVGVGNDGTSSLFTYDMGTKTLTEDVAVTDVDGNALAVESASLVKGNVFFGTPDELWVQDRLADENGDGYRFHILDTATGRSTYDTAVNTNSYQDTSLLFSDHAYDSWTGGLVAVNGTGKLFFSEYPQDNDLGSSWFNLSSDCLVAVAKGESWSYYVSQYTRFYVLDAANQRIIACDLSYSSFFGWSVYMNYYDLDQPMVFTPDESGVYQDSMVYDADTQTPILFHDGGVYALSLDKAAGKANVIPLGRLNSSYTSTAMYAVTYNGPADSVEAEAITLPESEYAPTGDVAYLTGTSEGAAPAGFLNAIPNAAPSAGNDSGTVTVTVRAEAAARSGMLDIALGDGLELVSVASPALLSGWKQSGSTLALGYAGIKTIEAGEVIAVLTLRHTDSQETSVTVTETERGGKTLAEAETVVIPGEGEANIYTVIFNAQGGSSVQPQYVKAGERALPPMAPAKESYTFCGWYTDPACTNRYDFSWTVNADLVLYAKWVLASSPVQPPIWDNPAQPNGKDDNTDVTPSAPTFTDVPGTHWAFDAVEFMAGNGWFNGVDATHFDPNGKLTRAMLVTVLWRMEGKPNAAYTGTFADVPAGQWYTTAVEWAASNGVVNGTGNGFDPNGYVTREQIAAILWRLEGKPAASGSLSAYPDGAQVSAYAKDAMIWAVEVGLFKGDDQGHLNPGATATRAEAATLLQRYAQ